MKYEIKGGDLPVVIMYVEPNESIITQGGGMSWMSPNMTMNTTSGGGIGKAFGRMLSGESMFQNIYTPTGGTGILACSSSFPGSIQAFQITPDNPMIFQKTAFLCSESSVDISMYFKRDLGVGFFGGEGFIMQKISGNGIVFCEFDGSVIDYTLGAGQQIVVSTGYLAAMSASCTMDVQSTGSFKNAIFGGEGFFNTVVTGPGRVWLQSMPKSKLASYFISRK